MSQEGETLCPKCGAVVETGRFCSRCGANLQEEFVQSEREQQQSDKPGTFIYEAKAGWRRLWAMPTWVKMASGGAAVVLLVFIVATAFGRVEGDGGSNRRSNPPAEGQEAPKSGFDKANFPSYDGADLSGYARFLAKEDSANCTSSFIQRVRRFASDTFTYQPLVYPEDTDEFIRYLRQHCSAEGHPIR